MPEGRLRYACRMCVLALAWDIHPRWKLLLIGNRDEAHARPSAPLARWPEVPGLIAGRDLEAGGTWMGVHVSGRVAVVTNVRDPHAAKDGLSRGLLVSDFLAGAQDAMAHAASLAARAIHYRPFNLLLADRGGACCVSNHPRARSCAIAAGVHGLSNAELDAPWPKTQRAAAALGAWMAAGSADFTALLDAFGDETLAADAGLPDTGIGLELERRLSPVFIRGEAYGTRATTVIALERDGGGCIVERRFGPNGVREGETAFDF